MIKAVINSVEYGQDKISYCKTYGSLFSGNTLSVGGVVSRQIDITLINPGDIPRGAKITLYDGDEMQGEFWIDTRQDAENGSLSIQGYDAMLKAEQVYQKEGDVGAWPRTMKTVVSDISSKIGAPLDDRSEIGNYNVEYPNDYTMREILSYIAAANGGNWIITKNGKLYLCPIYLPEETNYLIDHEGNSIVFGEVKLIV